MRFKLLIIWSIVWASAFAILCMILFSIPIPNPSYQFFEVLTFTDVTSKYSFNPTIFRLIFEPFVGIGHFFLMSTEGLIIIFGGYVLIRILANRLNKRVYNDQFSNSQFIIVLERVLTWFSSIFLISFLIILIILLVGFFIVGFLMIGWNAFKIMQFNLHLNSIILISIVIYYLIKFIKSKKTQNQNNTINFADRIDSIQNRYYKWRSRRKLYQLLIKNKIIRDLSRETRRLFTIGIIFGYILMIFIFTPTPTMKISTQLDSNELLFDFHVHTSNSDGQISPEERVRWYINQGINGAAISDHHGITGALDARRYVERNSLNFTVIIAQEYTISDPRVHLNIYGLEENINPLYFVEGDFEIPLETPYLNSEFLNISDMITYVKNKGGYVTVNHYGGEDPYTYQQFKDWGVDGFEVLNGGRIYSEVREFCLNNDLICIGGSDIHEGWDLNMFVKISLEDPNNKTVDAIFSALKENTHEIVRIDTQYGLISENIFTKIFPSMMPYFASLGYDQRISWIIWSIGVYIVGIIVYLSVRKNINRNLMRV